MNELSEKEIETLNKYRSVALEIRRSSIVENDSTPHLHIEIKENIYDEKFDGLPREALRSLAVALRQVVLQQEDTNFHKVHNILCKNGDDKIRQTAAALYGLYRKILEGIEIEVTIGNQKIRHEEILNVWLYGYLIHQDSDKKEQLKRLSQLGAVVNWVLEKVIIQLTDCVLQLDDIVADILGQERA